MNPQTRRAFDDAARSIVAAFQRTGAVTEQEVTPPVLIEAIGQCFKVCGDSGMAQRLAPDEVSEIGTHALDCIHDLSVWAYQLKLSAEQQAIEDVALEFAQWIAQEGGEIRVLEPVVNALARRANALHVPDELVPLYCLARDIIAHVRPKSGNHTSSPDPVAPWRILNFNCAIIATRTQKPELMHAAYDSLEHNLPQDCAGFFEEGVREAEKKVYAPHVREIMRERLAKWTVRH